MEITCPQCRFARTIPDEKIPDRAEIATCPKCKHKFRFRNLEGAPSASLTSAGDPAARDAFSSDPEAMVSVSAKDALKRPKDDPAPDGPDEPDDKDGEEFWDKLASMGRPHQEALQETDPGHDAKAHHVEVPWEHLDKYGFFSGIWETIKRAMLQPTAFFQSMPVGKGQIKPLIFYLLIAQFQIVMQMLWGMTGMGAGVTGEAETAGASAAMLLFGYPLLFTILLYAMALLVHVCLTLVKGAGRGFEGTFRALTYGSAPMIMALIPMIGPLVGAVWSLVVTFLGYKNIHRTTSGKVLLAMLLPLIPLGLLVLMVVTMFQGGGTSSF